MKHTYITLAACLFFTAGMQAQGIDEVLRQIEQNNKELQAQQQATRAAQLEVQTQNNLEDPSVEYSPFYTRGITGMSSSELVVTQGFDFPTLYAARSRSGKLQREALHRQYEATRRSILLNAKNLCLDLVMLNKQQGLLEERKKNADELLALFEKRLEEGDAGILEVNKIKMERMSVQTEVSQNNAAHRTALQQLLAMNGNLPVDFTSRDYPQVEALKDYNALYDEVMTTDATLLAADAADLPALADKLAHEYDILIATEVGGGVVPMDVKQRADREAAGRLACLLAARAECVVQMFCGIPTVLKGELSQC